MPNKFKATWVSHSSLSDFKKCRRSYYFRNVYKDDKKRKLSIASPHLSLGVGVHDQLEPLAWIPAADRLNVPFEDQFVKDFEKYRGEIGGFKDNDEFEFFKSRGIDMLGNVRKNPGPLIKPAYRMMKDKSELPWMWLSEKEEIILSGKVDWLEEDGGMNVYDFKTSKSHSEDPGSLQLPIYQLLIKNLKNKTINKAFYWYIAIDKEPFEQTLPDYKNSYESVLELAMKVKEARASNDLKCPRNGCWNCEPYERILKGEGKLVGIGGYGAATYFL